jgi:hypothetical protein
MLFPVGLRWNDGPSARRADRVPARRERRAGGGLHAGKDSAGRFQQLHDQHPLSGGR